ncbi:MAG TPA: glutaredoxin 3 [Kofleriaceae bacterium]|nr:glutaredoxin 3 [Kofleriaceae bacterium]
MARIAIYTTSYCGYCWSALRLLEKKGLAFDKHDVTGDAATRRWLIEATGRRTVPQVFIDGRAIGGYTDLAALDRSGELDRLLAAPPPAP